VLLPRSATNKPVTLLHVGRITEGKGQKEAVEACEILYKQGVAFQLICVGDMDLDYEKEFTAYLENKPYASSIQLKGFAQNVAGYYQDADIFIFPSKGEGLSNAFMEALSYGLICIAFANTSFPELRDLGFDFFMAKDQDMSDLKQKLLQSVEFFFTNEMPLEKQSHMAVEFFSTKRELNEYVSLLQ
jgi:glycosyltransferase involved in cell wall biosynthesis